MTALKPGGGAGGVPTTRTLAGLDLSQDRSAAALLAALGLPSNTSGTYASRPASPAFGDTYYVTSGQRKGSLYECREAGQWTLVDVRTGLVESLLFDAERLPASGACRTWEPVRAPRGMMVAAPWTTYACPWVTTGSLGGMSALAFGSTLAEANTFLATEGLPVGLGSDKTVIVAISGWNTGVNNGVLCLSSKSSTTGSVGIWTCFPGSGWADVGVEYEGGATSFYRSGNTVTVGSAVHSIIWTWAAGTGTSRIYVDGSPASTPTQVPGSTRGVLARQASLIIGAGRSSAAGPYDGKMHAVGIIDRVISDSDAAAAHTFYAARFS